MTENDKTTRRDFSAYPIDTDDVRMAVPELTPPSSTLNDEDEPVYESPLTLFKPRQTTPDNAGMRKESAQSRTREPRCKANDIYDSCYDETELNGRRYTGYSYASTAIDSPSVDTDGIWFANPIKVTDDDDDVYAYADIEGCKRESRVRENTIYDGLGENWKTYTASSAFTIEGKRNPSGSTFKRKQSRRKWPTCSLWLVIIISCAAFAFACLSYLNSKKALSNYNQSNYNVTSSKNSSNTRRRNEKSQQSGNTTRDSKQRKVPKLDESAQNDLLFQKFSKLSENVKELKNKNALLFQNFSKLSENFKEFKKKKEEDNMRFTKMNNSFWEQLKSGVLRGPKGYNGTRGRDGRRGKPGPPGITLKNYTCDYGSVNKTLKEWTKTEVSRNMKRYQATEIIYQVSCASNRTGDKARLRRNGDRLICECEDEGTLTSKAVRYPSCIMNYIICTLQQWTKQ